MKLESILITALALVSLSAFADEPKAKETQKQPAVTAKAPTPVKPNPLPVTPNPLPVPEPAKPEAPVTTQPATPAQPVPPQPVPPQPQPQPGTQAEAQAVCFCADSYTGLQGCAVGKVNRGLCEDPQVALRPLAEIPSYRNPESCLLEDTHTGEIRGGSVRCIVTGAISCR